MPNDITSTVVAGGPAELYRASCAAGQIHPDPEQTHAADRLQQLYAGLATHRPELRRGWRSRLGLAAPISEAPPRGLYLWGPVGRGKSMLMDLFFSSAPVERKLRVLFHAFMLDVHSRFERERSARIPAHGPR